MAEPTNRILPGCYYPGCDEEHPPGKKFCENPHDQASLDARRRAKEGEREATFPDHPVVPQKDAEFTVIPGSEDMDWDDEPEDDDAWMDDNEAHESWIAKQMKGI